ncbi:MAG: 50S ribosomal protein L31 [Chloroflexi bacterium]|nr:50S ribosomal protein L31 [Chloroflexota bacterium]
MKGNIHPEYYPEAQVICSCGNTWNVGATVPTIRTDVCSKCHPFFTGQMRIVDSGGRVERFMKKLEQRDQAIADAEAERKRAMSPALPISELGVGSRTVAVLSGAGVVTVGDLLAKLEEGEETLTNLRGFGLKSLATVKKTLRGRGFVLPGDDGDEGESDIEPEED